MKRIIIGLTFLLALMNTGCEEDNEINPLVGVWNMTEISGGLFIIVNKTQEIFLGYNEGSVSANTYIDEITYDTFSLTEFNAYNDQDGVFISVNTPYTEQTYASYQINDYYGSLDQYDQSSFNINDQNGSYRYVGTGFDYKLDDRSVKVFPDTVYREVYINGNYIIDSTRYAILEGSIKQVGNVINANEKFSMGDNFFFPEEVTLTLNEDGTGTLKESFFGDTYEETIEWIATDSTFQWRVCYGNDDQDEPDCEDGPIFKSNINENSLVLYSYQDQCEYMEAGMCDNMMNELYGIEIGTLDEFWSEINANFSKNPTSKKMTSINSNIKTQGAKGISLINGFEFRQ